MRLDATRSHSSPPARQRRRVDLANVVDAPLDDVAHVRRLAATNRTVEPLDTPDSTSAAAHGDPQIFVTSKAVKPSYYFSL